MKPSEIKPRLKRSGRSQAALARHLRISKDSMNRLANEQRAMSAEEAEAIREFFGEDQQAGPQFVQIPVYGYAAEGGDDRVSLDEGQVLDRIEVPAGLTRGAAIAIRQRGESMAPRIYSGELVIVGLGVPPTRNGDCVVELRGGGAVVKQYKGERDGFVFLQQLNPDEEVRIEAAKIKAIHAVTYRR